MPPPIFYPLPLRIVPFMGQCRALFFYVALCRKMLLFVKTHSLHSFIIALAITQKWLKYWTFAKKHTVYTVWLIGVRGWRWR